MEGRNTGHQARVHRVHDPQAQASAAIYGVVEKLGLHLVQIFDPRAVSPGDARHRAPAARGLDPSTAHVPIAIARLHHGPHGRGLLHADAKGQHGQGFVGGVRQHIAHRVAVHHHLDAGHTATHVGQRPRIDQQRYVHGVVSKGRATHQHRIRELHGRITQVLLAQARPLHGAQWVTAGQFVCRSALRQGGSAVQQSCTCTPCDDLASGGLRGLPGCHAVSCL